MAYTDGEGVMYEVEFFIKRLYEKISEMALGPELFLPNIAFPRMTYSDAMSKHGSDKPDLRIRDLVNCFPGLDFTQLTSTDPSYR